MDSAGLAVVLLECLVSSLADYVQIVASHNNVTLSAWQALVLHELNQCKQISWTIKNPYNCVNTDNAIYSPKEKIYFSSINFIERRDCGVNTLAFYSGVHGFKSRLRDRLSWVVFHSFPKSLQANAEIVP
jgi:hypothetical protein